MNPAPGGWLYTVDMSSSRPQRHAAVWIALLAVLLAALAPSVSQALGFARGAGPSWVEVCSAEGAKWVPADAGAGASADDASADDGTSHGPAAAHWMEHCPWCSLHQPALAVPPAPAALPLVNGLTEALPRAFLQAPRTLHAWASAQPRAPPLTA